jgi:hypothetical protein
MVVYDRNVVSVSPLPSEANPPLVIDPDTVLSLAITFKGFKSVAGRYLQTTGFPSNVPAAVNASYIVRWIACGPSKSRALV